MQSCRKFVLFLFPLFLLLCLAAPTSAATIVMMSDKNLVINSRLIVTGTVRHITSAFNNTERLAWTYIEIECDKVLKGELAGQTIVLKQAGGDFAEFGVHVFGQPQFAEGQRVLLYLNTAPDGSLRVAHNLLGRFAILKDADGMETVERDLSDATVFYKSKEEFSYSAVSEFIIQDPISRFIEAYTNRAPMVAYLGKIQTTLQESRQQVSDYEAIQADRPLVIIPPEYQSVKETQTVMPNFVLTANGIRWSQFDAGQSVGIYLNSARSPVVGGGTTEITRALSAWAAQSGANIRLELAGTTGSCGHISDNTNTISFGDCQNQLDPPVGCSGVAAQTSVWYTNDISNVNGVTFRRIVETDVVFNKNLDCLLSNPATLAGVACHELGHSIGLSHSGDPAAIMYAIVQSRRDANLGADDKAGALAIYPSSGGSGGGGSGGSGGGGTGGGGTGGGGTGDGGGGTTIVLPSVSRVKVKGSKKLIVYGQNFTPDCRVIINDFVFYPKSIEADVLSLKGQFNLRSTGTNYLRVVNDVYGSSLFTF